MTGTSSQRLARASQVFCDAFAVAPALVRRGELSMLLAEPPRSQDSTALAVWRGRIDSVAAWGRYSDPCVHAAYAPFGKSGRKLFDLLEQNRVDALAADDFPGMRSNLAALYSEKWVRTRPEGAIRGVGTGWIETLALLARVPLGAPLPDAALRVFEKRWHTWMAPATAATLRAMRDLLDVQQAFAQNALLIISTELGPEEELRSTRRSDEPFERSEQKKSAPLHAAPLKDDDSESRDVSQETRRRGSETQEKSRRAAAGPPTYGVYTRQFDRVSKAIDLRDGATLERRRRELDQHGHDHLTAISRWAHRLQRQLLALQRRSWQFDCEEGVLDASRLARTVTRPLEPPAYKQETDSEFPDTIVSLLIDNSGSMRGAPIRMAAACAEVLGRVLERCGVKTEILGFTTHTWGGGKARRKWVADGCPPSPGRLADLHNVVYKSAEEPWRRARRHLGLMLEDDLLKENIDGEALLWAVDRLRQRREPRRILIVISDGAPLDEATLAANDPQILDRHLRSVIQWVERCVPVELLAIGIGHDVNAYYRRAVTLDSVDRLGEALVLQLIELLGSRPGRAIPERQEKR
jgi:cobaltochelatase CobT